MRLAVTLERAMHPRRAMPQISRAPKLVSKWLPGWPWLGELDPIGGRAANHADDLDLQRHALASRYAVESAMARPQGCTRYRATRRIDDAPVWIVIPDGAPSHRSLVSSTFVRVGERARGLRHPYVLRIHDVGLVDDGRPYVVVARVPSESLASWVARCGRRTWPEVRTIALRLCSAVAAVRGRGLAPREIDMGSCLHVRDGVDPVDVRLGELFVPSSSCAEERDAPAIAAIVLALLDPERTPELDAAWLQRLDLVDDVRELSEVLAAVAHDGVRESHGANHAAVAGELEIEEAVADAWMYARPSDAPP